METLRKLTSWESLHTSSGITELIRAPIWMLLCVENLSRCWICVFCNLPVLVFHPQNQNWTKEFYFTGNMHI